VNGKAAPVSAKKATIPIAVKAPVKGKRVEQKEEVEEDDEDEDEVMMDDDDDEDEEDEEDDVEEEPVIAPRAEKGKGGQKKGLAGQVTPTVSKRDAAFIAAVKGNGGGGKAKANSQPQKKKAGGKK
jgi:hypothetical protein